MRTYQCLITDDLPIARDIIVNYCGHLPMLKVVACCNNALEAKMELQKNRIDILFLDINMPILDGISFLKTIKNPPQVIFTTAYKEYALDAFDLSAADYLLKPFSMERFIMAVDKAIERLNKTVGENTIAVPPAPESLFIKTDGKIFKVALNEILYAEASGNFTRIITTSNTYLPTMTFSALEQQLPRSAFIRVHRSFIISKTAITHLEGNRVFIGKYEIPLGSNYKEVFLKELGIG